MRKTKPKAQKRTVKKVSATVTKASKKSPLLNIDLNWQKHMIGKTIYTMQDNKILSGKVIEVQAKTCKEQITVHYLVEETNDLRNVLKFFHRDCFTSISNLMADLKRSFEEEQLFAYTKNLEKLEA